MICLIEGCGGEPHARGWCKKHYLRWMKYGDPTFTKTAGTGEPMAFIERVALKAKGGDCVIWPFGGQNDKRGTVRYDDKNWHAARLVCWLAHGPAPEDRPESAHSCGNGHLGCVSANHLRWANRSENLMDRVQHNTHIRGERHHAAKLNRETVLAIRELRGKKTQREIAVQFGISPGHVSYIQTRKTWYWLAD